MEKKYQETLDYLHEEAAKASPHSQHEANLLTLIDVFEELIKENQELKELEKTMDDIYNNLQRNSEEKSEDILKLVKENLKLKKAIEILKIKRVDLDIFMNCTSLEEYNNAMEYTYKSISENYKLTEQDYAILKEVMNDEIL